MVIRKFSLNKFKLESSATIKKYLSIVSSKRYFLRKRRMTNKCVNFEYFAINSVSNIIKHLSFNEIPFFYAMVRMILASKIANDLFICSTPSMCIYYACYSLKINIPSSHMQFYCPVFYSSK